MADAAFNTGVVSLGDGHRSAFCIRCGVKATAKGRCQKHYHQDFRTTSDGVHTGPIPKLSSADVVEIKRMAAGLAKRKTIAERFGVSTVTIAKVLSGTYTPNDQEST